MPIHPNTIYRLNASMRDGLPVIVTGGGRTTYSPTKFAQIDPDNDGASPVGWNNWQQAQTLSVLDKSGNATGWSMTTPQNWSEAGLGTSTGNNSGIYPDDVLTSVWYTQTPTTINLTGLDATKFYDIAMLGSRAGSTDRASLYTVGGTSVNQINDNNTNNPAMFYKVVPSKGGINIVVAAGTNAQSAASPYAYLNAITIQEYSKIVLST